MNCCDDEFLENVKKRRTPTGLTQWIEVTPGKLKQPLRHQDIDPSGALRKHALDPLAYVYIYILCRPKNGNRKHRFWWHLECNIYPAGKSLKEMKWKFYLETQLDYFYNQSPATMLEIQIYTIKAKWKSYLFEEKVKSDKSNNTYNGNWSGFEQWGVSA